MAVPDEGKPSKMLEVGRLPALGCAFPWEFADLTDNTWNAYACDINETVVLENAKFINESGLLQAGYEYVCIDGNCFSCFVFPDFRLLDGK